MQRVKWWTASLVSRIDWMVRQVENHEAVALSAIQDVQRGAARARVQLARVRRDGEQLRARREEAREAGLTWRERARGSAGADEARALECLRRARRADRQASELSRRLDEHERIEKQLAHDVARIGERLSELRERHNVLRTRQSRAEALGVVRDAAPLGADLGDLFERWETHVTEREFAGDCAVPFADEPDADAFAGEFEAREEEAELREELRTLTSHAAATHDDPSQNPEADDHV